MVIDISIAWLPFDGCCYAVITYIFHTPSHCYYDVAGGAIFALLCLHYCHWLLAAATSFGASIITLFVYWLRQRRLFGLPRHMLSLSTMASIRPALHGYWPVAAYVAHAVSHACLPPAELVYHVTTLLLSLWAQ